MIVTVTLEDEWGNRYTRVYHDQSTMIFPVSDLVNLITADGTPVVKITAEVTS